MVLLGSWSAVLVVVVAAGLWEQGYTQRRGEAISRYCISH